MKSPFKFLDAYTLEDSSTFFGRETEVNALYEMVFKSPLSLVYGLAGTGKTSIIQCGLASRFYGPDWFPFFIRRQENISDSLHAELAPFLSQDSGESLCDKISDLAIEYFRPIYLIFDQFEELFILGSQEEQATFLGEITNLLAADLPCRIIFVMREEFLGHLFHFEQSIPYLFDFRLRVEPMSNKSVGVVMTLSFDAFNIDLEPPEEDRLLQMTTNLSAEKARIPLPYLQVYLDLLYRSSLAGNEPIENGLLPKVTFTEQGITQLGKIEHVLERYLDEQEASLQYNLENRFEEVPERWMSHLLDIFVTEEGTKRPINYVREGGYILLHEKWIDFLPKASQELLTESLKGLEKRRLIRSSNDKTFELAHDSLAELIDKKRSENQRQKNEVLRVLKALYLDHLQTGSYLTEKQLNRLEVFIPVLNLESEVLAFIEQSHEQVKKAREKEIVSERRKVWIQIMAILAIIAVGAGVFGLDQRDDAIEARDDANEAKAALEKQQALQNFRDARYLKEIGQYDTAIIKLDFAALQADLKGIDLPENPDLLKQKWQRIRALVFEADSHLNLAKIEVRNLLRAKENYDSAFHIEPDTLIAEKIKSTDVRVDNFFEGYIDQARTIARNQSCRHRSTRYALRMADSLKPGSEEVRQIKQDCGIVVDLVMK